MTIIISSRKIGSKSLGLFAVLFQSTLNKINLTFTLTLRSCNCNYRIFFSHQIIYSIYLNNFTGPPNPPSAPTIVTHIDNLNYTTLRWIEGIPNGLEPTRHQIEALTNRAPIWTVLADGMLPVRTIYSQTIRRELDLDVRLQPFNSYKFRMAVGNQAGMSGPSLTSLSLDVPMAPPFRAPYKIVGTGGRSGELVVSWILIPPFEQNGPGFGYMVRSSKDLNGTGRHPEVTVSGSRSRAVIRLESTSSKEKIAYQVQVAAYNDAGQGPWSEVIAVQPIDDGIIPLSLSEIDLEFHR